MSAIEDANDLRLEADLLDALDALKNKKPIRFVFIVEKEGGIRTYTWWHGLDAYQAIGFIYCGLDWAKRKIQG